MVGNLAPLIPAIFTGPNGERLTADQIKRRQEIAESLMAQATDTSPNAGGWASIAAKGLAGFQAGRERRSADNAAGVNAAASAANMRGLLGSFLGGSPAAATAIPAAASTGVGAELAGTSPNPVSAVDISGDKQTFVASLLPAAIEESKRTGVDPRIIVAQAAQETGWGRSAPGNNYFGIKSHGQDGGNSLMTNEVIDGKTVRIRDSFRQFGSPEESVRGYGDFILQNPRYRPLREAQGLDAQLEALQASGYATDPDYSRSVGAIARGIQLPEFDGGRFAETAAVSDPNSVAAALDQQAMVPPLPAPTEVASLPVAGYQDTISSPNASPVASALAAQPAPATVQPQMAQATMPPINPAVIETLTSPYASDDEKAVAQAMLGQYQSQQQAMEKRALAEQQRAAEIARRQQIAQQAGIDPNYASDDDIWKAAAGNIFAPPSTSTVEGAVIDNRTGQPIYQAPPQNYRQVYGDEAAAMGLDPSKAYNVGPNGEVRPIGEGGVTVNNNMGSDKFGEEFAKLDASSLNAVSTSGLAAQRNLGRINQLEELLASSPTGLAGAAAQRAGEWGINTEGLDTLQAAQAAINSLVPEQRQPGSGPMSDADLALFKQSLPRIINQPGGNQLIIGTMRSIAEYDAQGAQIVQQLRNGDINRAQAFQMLQSRPNPLESFKVPAQQENPLPAQTGGTAPKAGGRFRYNPATGELE